MFNYHNLNDVEFEELCKDIMQKLLATDLRIFAKGRDRGIDLTDSTISHNIIVQVKHYINSQFSNLRTTLTHEIKKVNEWKPKQYYICCGMTLTDGNTKEIYDMFSSYMESDKNILSLKEIDDFLQKPENDDIVRKHYKLWLYSSDILSQVYNQNIFIDCEALLSDIEEDCKFFVQTTSYDECLKCLDKNKIILMIGAPGVGKTITSKMLVLFFASQGYRVRYTANGDITDLKRSLSNLPEIILLDDCLGQHYFNMKDTQETELLSLIKHIKISPNKMLILNSRVTIFNEAKERSEEFKVFLQGNKVKVHTINMDLISSLEKAKIFYNHLVFKAIPKDYYASIRTDKRYIKIVNHRNYTPRIIEHITNPHNYNQIPPTKYFDYIFEVLSKPEDIWKNEFNRRLQNVDRAFMSTLYSLTDTKIDCDVFKKCFWNRLKLMNDVDYTLNHFELVLARLNQSIINIVDNKGVKQIGVINPSVNDYLKIVFSENSTELDEVRKSIVNYNQLQRCYKNVELEEILLKMISDGSILDLDFKSQQEKNHFIVSSLCEFKILNKLYCDSIVQFLNETSLYTVSIVGLLSTSQIIESLSQAPLREFYNFTEIVSNKGIIDNIFSNMALDQLVDTIDTLFKYYQDEFIDAEIIDWFVPLCHSKIMEAMVEYFDSADTSSYCENYDLGDLIRENTNQVYSIHGYEDTEFDMGGTIGTIEQMVEEDIKDELTELLSNLPDIIRNRIDLTEASIDVDRGEIESIINAYFEPDIDYDEYRHGGTNESNYIDVIEAIFERE
ncbi:hypothetical protein JCM14036_12570 [Desulfotomaculum defluvii]